MTIDLFISFFITGIALLSVLLYLLRVITRGKAVYERVEKQGGSRLFSKELMAMGYWCFEPLGHWCHRRGFSPNQITWISFLFGFIAAFAVSFGYFGLGALCLLMAGWLDVLDGMVARLIGSNDPAGMVLDSSLDRYVDFIFLAGLVIYYRDSTLIMVIVLLAILGSFMISYSTAKAEAMQITPPRGSMKRSERLLYLIVACVLAPYSITYLETDWAFSPALGLPVLIVVCAIALLSNISAVQRLTSVALQARKNQNSAP